MTKEGIEHSSEEDIRIDSKEEFKTYAEDTVKNELIEKEDLKDIEELLLNLTLQNYEAKVPVEELESKLQCVSMKIDFEEKNEEITPAIMFDKDQDTEKEWNQTSTGNNQLSSSIEEEEKQDIPPQVDEEAPLTSEDGCDTENLSHKDLVKDRRIVELMTTISVSIGETSEEEDLPEHFLMTRGPVNDHKNQSNRFSTLGLYSQQSRQGNLHNQGHYRHSTFDDSNDTSLFDVVKFHPGDDTVPQCYGLDSSTSQKLANSDCYNQLSPESVHSLNSSSLYSNNFAPLSFRLTTFGLQTELSNDNCSRVPSDQFPDCFSTDFGYQPLSPPQSVSPFLKDGQDTNQSGIVEESEKEDDDLINIIDTLSDTSKAKIPEIELVNLRNVLEGNEDTIRHEMSVYLKDEDNCFQPSFTSAEQSPVNHTTGDFPLSCEGPLTPPKSVSPVQESCMYNGFSAVSDYRSNDELNAYNSEEHLNDILNGIVEINPDELNIYLKDENTAYDPSFARNIIYYERCEPNKRDKVLSKLSSLSDEDLCKKDEDEDTCLMIVNSKPEHSPCFFENVFCLQEKVMKIKLCCDAPLGKAKSCKICGNTDASKFYTLLSHRNKQGDTALSCAMKTNHSDIIVYYLLYGILQCEEDFRRVFDDKGKVLMADIAHNYPYLKRYL